MTYTSPYPDGLPGHHDRDTEIAAAMRALGTASKVTRLVLEQLHIKGATGLTYLEAQRLTGWRSAQQRLSDLVQHGHVYDSGRRREGCTAWVLCTTWREHA